MTEAMTSRAAKIADEICPAGASVVASRRDIDVWIAARDAAFAALSRPPSVEKEAIARIIAPDAWGEMGHDDYLRRADEWSAKGRCDDDCLVGGYRQKAKDMVAASLAKADAILALIGEGR